MLWCYFKTVKNDISSSKKPFYLPFLAYNVSYLLHVNSVARRLVEIARLENKRQKMLSEVVQKYS